MAALIDAVGATIIGGLLLLVMINSMFNLQTQAINIEKLVLLAQVSENISTVITDYLNMAGAGTAGEILGSTGLNRLKFTTRDSSYTSSLRTFDFIQQNQTDAGFPFEIHVDGNLTAGPFMLSEPITITYFNADDNVIPFDNNVISASNLANIRYIRMELDFFYDSFSPMQVTGPDDTDPHNTVVIWRYFINTYL